VYNRGTITSLFLLLLTPPSSLLFANFPDYFFYISISIYQIMQCLLSQSSQQQEQIQTKMANKHHQQLACYIIVSGSRKCLANRNWICSFSWGFFPGFFLFLLLCACGNFSLKLISFIVLNRNKKNNFLSLWFYFSLAVHNDKNCQFFKSYFFNPCNCSPCHPCNLLIIFKLQLNTRNKSRNLCERSIQLLNSFSLIVYGWLQNVYASFAIISISPTHTHFYCIGNLFGWLAGDDTTQQTFFGDRQSNE
jgi:hypothetical protein